MAQAITPNRTTQLRLPVADRVQLRTPFEIHRDAKEMRSRRLVGAAALKIGRDKTYFATGLIHLCEPHLWWQRILQTPNNITTYTSSNTTLADNWVSKSSYKKPSDLPGLGISGSAITEGVAQFIKRVPADDTYNTSIVPLDAPPTYPDITGLPELIPVNCSMRSTESNPPNQPYYFRWAVPIGSTTPDVVCSFFFGGNVRTVVPPTTSGPSAGRFCLTITGDGQAILTEKVNSSWVPRKSMRWTTQAADPNVVQFGGCAIIPLSPDSIRFVFRSYPIVDVYNQSSGYGLIDKAFGEFNNVQALTAPERHELYVNIPSATGFVKPEYSTGEGAWELHVRRDLRGPFFVAKFLHPETGTFYDEPFLTNDVMTGSDIFTVYLQGFVTPGTSVDVAMYTADGTPLTVASSTSQSKSFYGVLNCRSYRVGLELNASDDQQQTPVLYGYTVTYAGSYQNRSATPSLLSPIDVALEGPGMTMNEDACRLEVADPLGSFPGLHTRANHRAQVNVYRTDTGALRSVLFEGMNVGTPSKPMAKAGRTYPGVDFYRYSVDLAGMWQRLEGKILRAPINFSVDPTASRDSRGVQPSQKVTTAISKLLELAGFDTYVIPDIPLRIWGGDQANLFLPGGTRIATALQQLVGTYFNGVLTWCPNTGSAGAWRLILPPVYVYGTATQLATFTTVSGSSKIGMFTAENATTGEIVDESLIITPRGPEFNALDVYGQSGVNVFWRNTDSFDFFSGSADPTSIDYVGEIKPFIYYDPAISAPNPADAQAQANWIAYQLIRIGGHGYYEYKWEAPLLLLSPAQTLDPYQTLDRPLRVGDVVLVDSTPVIIRSVNARLNSDQHHMAAYEGVSLY